MSELDRRAPRGRGASAWTSPSRRRSTSSASVRTGRASPALLDRIVGRLLRRRDAAQAARDDHRARGAPAHRAALRQVLDQGDREGDHRVRPRPDAEQRRQPDPPRDPRADRGAPQGARQGRRGTSPRRAASRSATSAATCMHDLRELKDEGEVGADDEHRAEAELQKLTDARIAELDALLKGKEEEILEVVSGLDGRRRCRRRRALRRDHHRRQRALGAGARGLPGHRGPPRRAPTSSRRGCATPPTSASRELTVYSFSTENWSRPPEEVAGADGDVRRSASRARRRSCTTRACACASSGAATASRAELVRADGLGRGARPARRRASRCSSPSTTAGARRSLDAAARFDGGGEDEFRSLLYAPEMHDPDLVIRTSGEQRLSNYLLWQSAYSELVFRDELWPDFTREAFEESLAEYEAPRAPLRRPLMRRGRAAPARGRPERPRRARSAARRHGARTSARACSRRCRRSCSAIAHRRARAGCVFARRRCSCSASSACTSSSRCSTARARSRLGRLRRRSPALIARRRTTATSARSCSRCVCCVPLVVPARRSPQPRGAGVAGRSP